MEFEIRPVRPDDRGPLLSVWRNAVEATHHFLTAEDIDFFSGVVTRHLPVARDVRAAYDSQGRPVGFVVQDDGEIEMLFVEPALHGKGVGSLLLESVARDHDELRVDVNEQNPSGRAFYAAKGFDQVGRSPSDSSGRPFPLLHLRRSRGGQVTDRGTGLVSLPDGRALAYAEYGPADGTPVVFLPGAGCGRVMSFGADLLENRHVRLISIDRPGLGRSSADPHKTFASVAADVACLIDELAGHSVPVVANSQGAPFGLAVAAAGAVTRLVLASPIDDMAHPPIRALLPEHHRALIDDVEADPGRVLAALSNTTPAALCDMVMRDYPASDAPVYDDPAFRATFSAALSDGFRCGSDGYARDTVLAMTAWPDRLFTAGVPVALLMGHDDHAHSPDRGATLATRLDAHRTVVEDVGGSLLWARPELVLDALFDASA
jgi:pimeloyl-ACP methyl ester carboxylesterase/GNAT superfamily N-acetyltransferase